MAAYNMNNTGNHPPPVPPPPHPSIGVVLVSSVTIMAHHQILSSLCPCVGVACRFAYFSTIPPFCWQLTRCHRVLPSQVSHGLIGWVGVGIKYRKPFVCICKHTATRIRIWRGCPAEVRAEVGYLAVRFSWPSALHCNPCPAPCSPGNLPNPTPEPLMDITLRQDWSATLYHVITYQY